MYICVCVCVCVCASEYVQNITKSYERNFDQILWWGVAQRPIVTGPAFSGFFDEISENCCVAERAID